MSDANFFHFVFILAISFIANCYSDDCKYGEGFICRSYFKAISCGKLSACEDLWMHADIIDESFSSGDCRICEHFLISNNQAAVLKIIKHKMNISALTATSLDSLHSKLKSYKLTCTLLQQCNDSALTLPTLRFNSRETCEDCKRIISDVKVLIRENGTRMAVATYLKAAMCIHLPLQIVDICKKSVENYVGIIIDLILKEIDQNEICTLVGLCENDVEKKKISINMPEYGSNNVTSWIIRPSPKGFEKWNSRLTIKIDPQCEECITVLSRIRDVTYNPAYINSLRNKVQETMCESSGFLKSMCEVALFENFPEIIVNASKLDVEEVCTFFNQCSTHTPAALTNVFSKYRPRNNYEYKRHLATSKSEIPVFCEFCEVLMHKILEATINNRTAEAIVYALEQICSAFPTEEKLKCLQIIDDYGSTIVEAVVSGTAPKLFCSLIGLCGPVPDSDILTVLKNFTSTDVIDGNKDSDTCFICESIVEFLYDKLEENSTVETIEEHLKSVCRHIPHYGNQCVDLINAYGADLVKLFVNGAPPKRVCQLLKMCPEEKKYDVCQLCQLFVDYFYSKIEENRTIESITEMLESACTHIPYWKSECKDFVDKYSSALIRLLVDNVPSIEVCQSLNLCASKIHVDRLCSRGPVAWCLNSKTALLCSKTAFCQSIWALDASTQQPVPLFNTDCSRFLTIDQRCENMHIASFCGFSSGCNRYWANRKEINYFLPGCSFCRRILNKILTYGIHSVDCSLYLNSNRHKCEAIKATPFPELPTFETLNEVCSSLGMCEEKHLEASSTYDKQKFIGQKLLGSDICTWGPSVVCRDLKSAKFCKSLDYCKKNVWRSSRPKSVSTSSLDTIPGYTLVDCNMPLKELCSSSSIKHCSPTVVKRCENYLTEQRIQIGPKTSNFEEELKMRICANPATRVCGDERRVVFCGLQNFCDALGSPVINATSTSSPIEIQIDCNQGNAVLCQSYQNAVRCNAVERCRTEVWLS